MPLVRRTQRSVLSCTECARRKTRCSKTIPCSSCIDRGLAQACHREVVAVVKKDDSQQNLPSTDRIHYVQTEQRTLDSRRDPSRDDQHNEQPTTSVSREDLSPDSPQNTLMETQTVPVGALTNETVATLEFLTYGRQNILNLHNDDPALDTTSPSHGVEKTSEENTFGLSAPTWDTILSPREARLLLNFHEQRLAWMHNVLHMPTFKQEFELNILQKTVDGTWLALYYAVLSTTFYHCHEADIADLRIDVTACDSSARALYDKSVQCLFGTNFMAKHSIYSVQAICILMQVAHNIDQSDFICVLIATGIRIAQCLNMHRLGPDRPSTYFHRQPEDFIIRTLVEREIKKRVWWFLVRQDWLQIPFQNTYLIHATQFNTPLPLNCYEEPHLMIRDGVTVAQPEDVYTQNSYSHSLSKVAVIIWQQQDRMCSVGHPGNSSDGLQRIYDQVLWADKELNQVYTDMPYFLKIPGRDASPSSDCPPYIRLLASVSLLSMAHKVLTVHRHFQLQSFRDRRFAYTQLSCIAIATRCIRDVKAWSDDPMTSIIKRMWTIPTHLVTCCIILAFASIFRHENGLVYDASELHQLAQYGRDIIRQLEQSSSIARRGGILLDILLQLADSTDDTKHVQLDLSDIVRRVSRTDHNRTEGRMPEMENFVLQFGNDAWDGVFGTGDFDVMDVLKDIGM